MDCKDIQARLVRYLDDDLPGEVRRAVEKHLDHCYLCNEELNQIEVVLDRSRDLLQHPAPRSRFGELVPFMRPAGSTRGAVPRRGPRVGRLLSAAALAAAAIVILISLADPVAHAVRNMVTLADRAFEEPGAGLSLSTPRPVSMPALLAWQGYILWGEKISESVNAGDEASDGVASVAAEKPSDGKASAPMSSRLPAGAWWLVACLAPRSGPPAVYRASWGRDT
jgi:anti-sigma factor RsiW